MTQYAIIFALYTALTPWHQDRAEVNRDHRMGVLTESTKRTVNRATCDDGTRKNCVSIWPGTSQELTALLITTGWWESRFAKHIHEDRCRGFECDAFKLPGGRVIYRAKSTWQVQSSPLVPIKVWRTIGGSDLESTTRAALAATRVLSMARTRCGEVNGDWVASTISLYATGRTCRWPKAHNRVVMYKKIYDRYEELENQ